MHYIRSLRPNLKMTNERGSQVVGFALVAPLLVTLAVALFQIVGIGICKVSLAAATREAAHLAALKGSSNYLVMRSASDYWKPSGLRSCGKSSSTKRMKSSGISFVVVQVQQCLEIPILNKRVNLITTVRELDEGKL
jgi:hypothetical protein